MCAWGKTYGIKWKEALMGDWGRTKRNIHVMYIYKTTSSFNSACKYI